MAAKKKITKKPRKVPGTKRTHRMVDAEELRESVKHHAPGKVRR